MTTHIFGIRHHGPGSARSLRQALEQLRPEVVLVEGPPDANAVLKLLTEPDMRPPVAILVYQPDVPEKAVYFPFAVFSPEWQAILYALKHNIPVQFMDLPQTHHFALDLHESASAAPTPEETPATLNQDPTPTTPEATPLPEGAPQPEQQHQHPRLDPFAWIAQAAGYSDGERWWEHQVEQRRAREDLFAAILEMMTALRQELGWEPENPREALREAHMRQSIRAAQKKGYARIAVVCGAWHAPVLHQLPPPKADAALLKGLPKLKVEATWIPWTNGRLAASSGYGAGIESPGWYAHLWEHPDHVAPRWLTRVAHLLREQDLDAAPASVIEAVRLAESLAALRGRPLPGLPELNDATQAILCFGTESPMQLIAKKLIIGEALGQVPEAAPTVPLQRDLTATQKRLRFLPAAEQRKEDFDLRKPTDLERSHLLHRLRLLNVPWGEPQKMKQKGTFHELWQVQWKPEFALSVIEASRWGNTVVEAATQFVRDQALHAPNLPTLTQMLDKVLLANLPEVVATLIARVQAEAALTSDVSLLMDALPPLANTLRYGNVRQTDSGAVQQVVDGLVTRICIGLSGACASLNDEAAAEMFTRLNQTQGVVRLLQNAEHEAAWYAALQRLAEQTGLHGLVAGRSCRLLFDGKQFDAAETTRRLGLALSTATDPAHAAFWLEGLLKGSGLLLLHEVELWNAVDAWVTALKTETFTQLLPLLRRTFATFSAPERRQMGERVARKTQVLAPETEAEHFDAERAAEVLGMVRQLLGLG